MRVMLFLLLLVCLLTGFATIFVEGGVFFLLYAIDLIATAAAMLIVVKSVRVVIPDPAVIAKMNTKDQE